MAEDRDPLTPTAALTDWRLLELVQQGDQGALARLFELYSKIVYSVALRILRDPGAAEEVLQEVFMRIWSTPTTFNADQGKLGPWLAIVSRNRSIDVLRSRRTTTSLDDVPLVSPYDLAHDAERNVTLERVRHVVAQLPSEQRAVLDLAFFDGLTHLEIAERTGEPLGTIKTRIRLALKALRGAFTS